uniref:phospholipase A2 n=1 Tax=Panagrolaimus davidi TaxID=227884 RepID=A0A914P0M9_9BILA
MKIINAYDTDYDEKTPGELSDLLHYHTAEGNLDFVMKISSYDCDINAKDDNGNTPLHIAVSEKFLEITRTLLVMGANPNILNKNGETPRHIAAANLEDSDFIQTLIIGGANRCSSSKKGCKSGCMNENILEEVNDDVSLYNSFEELKKMENREHKLSNQKNQDEIYKQMMEALENMSNNNTKNYINVLSLDGGGVRGLVSLQILSEIEKMIGEPLFQYFDWVIGTSTGAIITAALTMGKSIRDCQKLYLRFKDDVFSRSISSPRSRTVALINFLQKEMGGTRLSDVPWPRLIFTTVKTNEPPGHRLKLIRNYQLYSSTMEEDLELVKVLQMSSAAPMYLEAVDEYIDGGLASNNPIHDLLTEMYQWNSGKRESEKKVRIGCAISIGTGIGPNDEPPKNLDFNGNRITNIPSFIDLAKLAMDQATASEGKTTEHAFARCSELGIPLFRLNPSLSKYVPLDTTSDYVLAEMMWESFVYAKNNQEQIKKMASLLKKNGPSFSRQQCFKKIPQSIPVLPVSDYIGSIKSNDPDVRLVGLKKLRKSLTDRSRCDKVVSCGITSIQYEAVSVINIVTTNRNTFIHGDRISLFFDLLSADVEEVRDEAMYAIGRTVHFASNCKKCVNLGIISILSEASHTKTSDTFSRSATRIMFYIARNMPEILSQQIARKMIQIQSMLTLQTDTDTVLYISLLIDCFDRAGLFSKMSLEDVGLICKILYDIIADDNFQIEHKALAFDCLLQIAVVSKIQIEASLVENFIPILNDLPEEIEFKFCNIFLQKCSIEFYVPSVMASKELKKKVYEFLNESGVTEAIKSYQNDSNTEIAQFSAKLITAFENI